MAPVARGIIIAASVIVAAGIAAYENPQVREWFERSREKIAVAFQSTLDDLRPARPKRDDPSMREDPDEKAEERRRQARQELMDRGKKLEQLRKRRSTNGGTPSSSSLLDEKRSPSFDTLVDEEGNLRPSETATAGSSSAVEAQDLSGSLRPRHHDTGASDQTSAQSQSYSLSQSTDFSVISEPIDDTTSTTHEPWESQYEREMRNTWNIPLPVHNNRTPTASTHPSESLLDLTPTTEDFPDPDYSVPSGSEAGSHDLHRTEYFSIPPSRTSTRSATAGRSEPDYYYAHPAAPSVPLQPRVSTTTIDTTNPAHPNIPGSSSASVAGSSVHADMIEHASEQSEDDFSELGDGIHTPASAWTEVGSTISSSDAEEIR